MNFILPQLKPFWYVAGYSKEFAHKPVTKTLLGMPLVFFRDAAGVVTALLDRCAHRNVPLSLGRVVEGRIECSYHGWQYDSQGVCRHIPALSGMPEGKARRVSYFATRELDGLVWVYGAADSAADHEPLRANHSPHHSIVNYSFTYEGSVYQALENILDVPHTAVLHRGLFRSPKPRGKIEACVRRIPWGVEAEFIGESRPRGLLGFLLAPKGGELKHFDRFLLPSVAQVEYSLGERSHVLVTNYLTPVSDFVTQVHTVVAYRLPFLQPLLRWFVTPVALRVVKQDAHILAAQSRNVQVFGGEQFVSTSVDVLGQSMQRLLRQAERNEHREPTTSEIVARVELLV